MRATFIAHGVPSTVKKVSFCRLKLTMGVFILSNYYQHRINKETSDGVRPLVLKKKKTPNERLKKSLDKINLGKPLLCRFESTVMLS